jgi:hypothetical protein
MFIVTRLADPMALWFGDVFCDVAVGAGLFLCRTAVCLYILLFTCCHYLALLRRSSSTLLIFLPFTCGRCHLDVVNIFGLSV